jgi:two-component system, cell cycle sensor histidine kinase and response regulator CckA
MAQSFLPFRLLLLEDFPEDAELVAHELRRAGFRFETLRCESAESFAESLEKWLPDIIIADYSLPSFTALDALRMLRERARDVPLILVTGSQREEVAVECIKQGAVDYILKSSLTRLPLAVSSALERRAMEQGRRHAEEEVRSLANFPRLDPNPVLALDSEGHVLYRNAAAQALAADREDVTCILPPEHRECVRNCLERGESIFSGDSRLGEQVYTWCFCPVPGSNKAHIYGFNITDRIQLEGELRQYQKLESIGQLAAGVAHDFNNILTVVQGYAAMLDDLGLKEEQAEPVRQIAAAAERAANLTRQLLAFSRKQMINPTKCELAEVVRSIEPMLRRTLGADVNLTLDIADDSLTIFADRGMIEQILVNLCVNARDAMMEGGAISISIGPEQIGDEDNHSDPSVRPGAYVMLSVRDNGSGIPPEIRSKIFDPFFTTKDVGKGSGLGLATVYGIVKQHQGWIEVQSEVGHGATFRIFLPRVERVVKSAVAVAGPPQLKAQVGKERILLVEDEPALKAMAERILAGRGYLVRSANSGLDALKVWDEQNGAFDLLLTDMVMPDGMSGRDLARKLLARKPGLRALFTSGYSPEAVSRGMTLTEGVNFLQKPYSPDALAHAVRTCLDHGGEGMGATATPVAGSR